MEDWIVAGDTLIDDARYFVVEVRCRSITSDEELDDPPACVEDAVEQRFFRYEKAGANVIELHVDGQASEERSAFYHDVRLDAPFFQWEPFDAADSEAGIEYVRPEEPLLMDGNEVDAVQKRLDVYDAVPGEMTFAHDIGLVTMCFSEGGGQRQTLTYAEVGGQTHGSARPVSSDRPVPPAAHWSINVYPNPAAGEVHVGYAAPDAGEVVFEIYDAAGRRVRSIEMGLRAAGSHRTTLDLSDLASGAYSLTLWAGGSRRAHASLIVVW